MSILKPPHPRREDTLVSIKMNGRHELLEKPEDAGQKNRRHEKPEEETENASLPLALSLAGNLPVQDHPEFVDLFLCHVSVS